MSSGQWLQRKRSKKWQNYPEYEPNFIKICAAI